MQRTKLRSSARSTALLASEPSLQRLVPALALSLPMFSSLSPGRLGSGLDFPCSSGCHRSAKVHGGAGGVLMTPTSPLGLTICSFHTNVTPLRRQVSRDSASQTGKLSQEIKKPVLRPLLWPKRAGRGSLGNFISK